MNSRNLESIADLTSKGLEEYGWAHLQTGIDPSDRETVRKLFHVMNRAVAIDAMNNPEISIIAPRDNSRVLATTREAMSFHTDNVYLDNPCRSVALFCATQAEAGGENELVDALATVQTMPPKVVDQLTAKQWQWMNPTTGNLSSEYSVVDSSLESLRWWRMGATSREIGAIAAADTFEEALDVSDTKIRIRLQPGELLVTDNTRIVHNRSAFSGKRHIYRARFW